jgi:hypothetical protein
MAEIERAMKAEHRTRSELVREALRIYLSARLMPSELPTPAEARAYRREMAAYRRGDSIPLQEYLDGVDRRPRRSRASKSLKRIPAGWPGECLETSVQLSLMQGSFDFVSASRSRS